MSNKPPWLHVGQRGGGKVERPVDAMPRARAVLVKGVKGPGLDERIHGALVDFAAVHAHAEVEQAGNRPAPVRASRPFATALARRDNGLDGLLACAFDGAQAIADHRVGDGLETVARPGSYPEARNSIPKFLRASSNSTLSLSVSSISTVMLAQKNSAV